MSGQQQAPKPQQESLAAHRRRRPDAIILEKPDGTRIVKVKRPK